MDLSKTSLMRRSVIDVGGITEIVVENGYAYITNDSGFHIYAVGSYDVLSFTGDAALSGEYACLANSTDGLLVLDIASLESPDLIGQCHTPGWVYDVEVQDNYAYLADWTGGLRVVDISLPEDPTEVGFCDALSASQVTVSGDHAYVIEAIPSGEFWLWVIDVSDPGNPTQLSSLGIPTHSRELALVGDYLYVARYDQGIRIVDVSDPGDPVEEGSFDLPEVMDLFARDNLLYVTSADYGDGGLCILDIQDPVNPTLIGQFTTTSFAPF